jgi:hypothetical protein
MPITENSKPTPITTKATAANNGDSGIKTWPNGGPG